MSAYQLAGIITGSVLALAALLGIAWAVIKWSYSRGAEERALTVAVRENTTVTADLSNELRGFKESTVNSLHDLRIKHERLDQRVVATEATLNRLGNSFGGTTAVPHAGPP